MTKRTFKRDCFHFVPLAIIFVCPHQFTSFPRSFSRTWINLSGTVKTWKWLGNCRYVWTAGSITNNYVPDHWLPLYIPEICDFICVFPRVVFSTALFNGYSFLKHLMNHFILLSCIPDSSFSPTYLPDILYVL